MNWLAPEYLENLTYAAIAAGIAIAAGLIIHLALFAVLSRIMGLSESKGGDEVVRRLRNPVRALLVAIAISIAAQAQPALREIWVHIAPFLVPALLGWTAYSLIQGLAAAMDIRAAHYPNEYAARSRRTRVAILSRAATAIIVFITVSLMLLGIPGVRSVGVTLMASAGLMGLAVGAAAQPALRSLIAGLQMAITEPIRLGDLIVIDGESGRVEDLRMSYVVIRTADHRRLIVPTSRFLDTTFQNWSRVSDGLTGTVVVPVNWGTPIEPIREKFHALVAEHPDWDGRTRDLTVSEARVGSIDLTLTVSAKRPTELSRLRVAVREAMVEWLRTAMPTAVYPISPLPPQMS